MNRNVIPKSVMERIPIYLHYLSSLSNENVEYISATKIANELKLGEVLVRKDLALLSGKGKPKIGYEKNELELHLKNVLDTSNVTNAIIIGAGKLGQALLYYEGFEEYGIRITCAFDSDHNKIDYQKIYNINDLDDYCIDNNIKIGIITVGEKSAQEVCNLLVSNGINKIWNFSPIQLSVPSYVNVKNENLAAGLAVLSMK